MSAVTAGAIALAAGGALASSVLSSALAPKAKQAAAPAAVAAPTAMPTADAGAVEAARKKSLLEQSVRSGRASTVLSDTSDKLGG